MMRMLGESNYRRCITVERGGRIALPMSLVRDLELSVGDVCDIGEEGGEYYFVVKMRGGTGIPRPKGSLWGSTRQLGFSNSRLAEEVFRITGSTSDRVRLMIGETKEIAGSKAVVIIMREQKR